jgi:hypothetical protein
MGCEETHPKMRGEFGGRCPGKGRSMKSTWKACVFGLVIVMALGSATAEITVSVSISGSIEELLPILRHLQDMGFGVGPTSAEDDPLQLEVFSVMSAEGEKPPEAPAEQKSVKMALKPVLSMTEAAVTPAPVKLGETALVTVSISDPDHVVDTVGATLGSLRDNSFDLFDNGTLGDAAANDGIWSRAVEVPATLPVGNHAVRVQAYDANGDPVMVTKKDGGSLPLSTETQCAVSE